MSRMDIHGETFEMFTIKEIGMMCVKILWVLFLVIDYIVIVFPLKVPALYKKDMWNMLCLLQLLTWYTYQTTIICI